MTNASPCPAPFFSSSASSNLQRKLRAPPPAALAFGTFCRVMRRTRRYCRLNCNFASLQPSLPEPAPDSNSHSGPHPHKSNAPTRPAVPVTANVARAPPPAKSWRQEKRVVVPRPSPQRVPPVPQPETATVHSPPACPCRSGADTPRVTAPAYPSRESSPRSRGVSLLQFDRAQSTFANAETTLLPFPRAPPEETPGPSRHATS